MSCCDFTKLANYRIVIRAPGLVTDAYGGQVNTWATVATVWAWIRPLNSFERSKQNQLQSDASHKIVIRYNSTFKDTKEFGANSITFDSRVYSIVGIKNLDMTLKNYGREFQEIMAIDNGPEILDG